MFRSISTVKADLAQAEFGVSGKGIVWAVVATGVDANHPHFKLFRNLDLPKPLYHMDYSNYRLKLTKSEREDILYERKDLADLLVDKRYRVSKPIDPIGLGTGVAGIIAGQSTRAEYGQLMKGLAPETKIISFKVFDDEGKASEFDTLAALLAIQRINEQNPDLLIHGVLIPVSFPWDVRNFACGVSPLCVEVERLVNSGVVVVTTSGNQGFDAERNASVEGGITDPGNTELAITVGSTSRTSPLVYGASFFSARGPTADGRRKPDLLAPGERIEVCWKLSTIEPQASRGRKSRRQATAAEVPGDDDYQDRDGTEFAAAHVAGAAAALLSARSDLIGKPQEVKDILLRTAVDLGREVMYQGAGLLDVLAAVRSVVEATKPARSAAEPLKVFCSYSHRDKKFCLEFKTHLRSLERAGLIEVWFDGMIEPGQRWEQEIYKKLDAADIILLLVSSYFVASEFCYSKELERAVEREATGAVRIVPIRVRPVSLKGTIIAEFQLLPSEGKPIKSLRDPHKGWAEVTDSLHDIAQKLKEKKL